MSRLVVRWTIGNVSSRGFEALALSIRAAWRLFGPQTDYVVCVNTVAVDEARRRLGLSIPDLYLVQVRPTDFPAWLRGRMDSSYAEGTAWRLAPVRVAPACSELSLDNDVILWRIPPGIQEWLAAGEGCVGAEGNRAAFGKFASSCGEEPRDAGIRGLPPGFAYEAALRHLLDEHPGTLESGADEQGIQAAALQRLDGERLVSAREVSVSSPHASYPAALGTHGVHFAGLNAKPSHPAPEAIHRAWDRQRAALERAVSEIAPARIAA
jgi:hypothetical protein